MWYKEINAKKKQGEMHNLQNDNFDHYILYLCKFNLHIMEKSEIERKWDGERKYE